MSHTSSDQRFFVLQMSSKMITVHVIPYTFVELSDKTLMVYGKGALLRRNVLATMTGLQMAARAISRGKRICLDIPYCNCR
jgi:hypothetical protein